MYNIFRNEFKRRIMKCIKKKYLVVLFVFSTYAIAAQQINTINKAPSTDGYYLVWEDNFDGNELNGDYWVVEIDGNGGGNNELQYYRRENISVGVESVTGANCLIITARKENFAGRVCTSGRLKTSGKMSFKYGKIQARIKLPKTANGLWPAFWMMGQDYPQVGWPKCGEIDILEMGNRNGIINGTQDRYFSSWFHWGESWTPQGYPNWGKSYTHPTGIQDDFFIFTLIWDENSLKTYFGPDENPFLVNIVEMGITGTTNPGQVARYFHKQFYVIFNLAIGGTYTGITGNSNIGQVTALANGDAHMYVDYVRVYQKGVANEEYTGPALANTSVPLIKTNEFSLHQNPVGNEIRIVGKETPKSIRIIDLKGISVISKMHTNTIDVSELASGYYIIIIENQVGQSETHNFIKN